MTKEEFELEADQFYWAARAFNDAAMTEWRGDDILISTYIDGLQFIRSDLEVADVDGDGVPDYRPVHWINIRLQGWEGAAERVHVRKVLSWKMTAETLDLVIEGGRIGLIEVSDSNHDGAREIVPWQKERHANLEAYLRFDKSLRDSARRMVERVTDI